MVLQVVKDILDKKISLNDYSSVLQQYLVDNHSKIIRKAFTNQVYTSEKCLFILTRYFLKKRLIATNYIDYDEAAYDLINGIQNKTCKYNNQMKLVSFEDGYFGCGSCKTCKCVRDKISENKTNISDEEKKLIDDKKKATFLKNYGVDNPAKSEEIKDKIVTTNLERYGFENAIQSSEIREKIRQTMIEKYGVENIFQSEVFKENNRKYYQENFGVDNPAQVPEIQKKIEETNLAKYGHKSSFVYAKQVFRDRFGVDNPWQLESVKQKSKQTMMERYGVEHNTQDPESNNRRKATNLKKYGNECIFQNKNLRDKWSQEYKIKTGYNHQMNNPEVLEKIINTSLVRYGKPHFGQLSISEKSFEILQDKEKFTNFINERSLNEAAKDLDVAFATVKLYLNKYKIKYDYNKSSYEKAIAYFLTENNIEFEQNTRKIISPKELDFYIPNLKLAIEFNGLYWHSESKLDNKNYHKEKWQACSDVGVRLLMINEDEWLERSEVIKKKILNLCRQSERGPGARKLQILTIPNNLANAFCEEHHIQGKTGNSVTSYGAFLEDQLVGVMIVGFLRGTKTEEIVRFCSDGKTYAGLFSRMFKKYITEKLPVEVVTFADLRYSDGGLYEKTGFVKDGIIKPNFKYVMGYETFHAQGFTKSRIANKFKIDMSFLTERQAMDGLGFDRIWDCGKIRYIWKP